MATSCSSDKNEVKCLNCGCACSGKFCPECGQPTSTARLEMRTLWRAILAGFFRVNGKFFFTLGQLLWRPGRVIMRYLMGYRICYTPPATMLVIMAFIVAIVKGIGDSWGLLVDTSLTASLAENATGGLRWFIQFVSENTIVATSLLLPPGMLALRMVYGKYGASRFNLAEYTIFAIYIASVIILGYTVYLLLLMLFDFDVADIIQYYYAFIFGKMLWDLFPCGSWRANIRRLILFVFITIILYIVWMTILYAALVLIVYGVQRPVSVTFSS
ncbi:MAG: DUF3667 domain-containing protein [Muribaculaceae bacterium]